MINSVLNRESVAVVTGAAAGIGLAIAREFAALGMAIVAVDNRDDVLAAAGKSLNDDGARAVMTTVTDVSDAAALRSLEIAVTEQFGGTDILVNNAGIQPGSSLFGGENTWRAILETNLGGVINGTRAFVPHMIERARPGIVINTGSKQGITTPPGDPAYNVAKAGVKAYTEALAHELRNGPGHRLSAHLLIPGFVFTELNARGRSEKPEGAWTPGQMAAFMMQRLRAGDFYILCPDNDVPRELDERRMAWAIGDVIDNRPALSRWHPDHAAEYEAFIQGE